MNIKYVSLLSFLCITGTSFCNYSKKTTLETILNKLNERDKRYEPNNTYPNIFVSPEIRVLEEMQNTYKKSHPQELGTELMLRKISLAYDQDQSLQDLTDTRILQKIALAYEQSLQNLDTYDQNDSLNPKLFEALYKHFCLKKMIDATERKTYPILNKTLHGGLYNAFHRHGGEQGLQKDSMGRECSNEACSLVPFFVDSAPMMLEIKDSAIFSSKFEKQKMFDRVHAECMELFDPEGLKKRQVEQNTLRYLYKYGPKHRSFKNDK